MAFFESRFPEQISANAQGGPRFVNSKAFMPGGQRITNRLSTYPLHEYSIAQPCRSGDEFETLRAFFYVVGGDADAFRFKDWTDYKAMASNSSLTLISGSIYQLNRIYVFGSRTFVRPIYKPNSGVVVTRTRSGVTSTATATVDTTTGQATITGHVDGDTYTWAGTFDVPVAFKDPAAVWQFIGTPRMLTEWTGIDLEEVRL